MTPDGLSRGDEKQNRQAEENYNRVMDTFHAQYAHDGLPEKLFLPERVNIELEHLLRYIDIMEHCHDFFEVVCILEGRCTHRVDKQNFLLTAGDLTIVPPQLSHHLTADPDCVGITIKIRTSTFEQTFSSLLKGQSLLSAYFSHSLYMFRTRSSLTFHCGNDNFIRQILLYMYAQQSAKHAYYDNIIENTMIILFFHLLQNHQDSLEFSHSITRYEQRIADVLDYMAANYRTATLTDTANAFFLNPSYLSASLRKSTGKTFSQHLRSFRLRRSAELLTQTNLRLEEICEEIGYQDTTQFIRYFKEAYGCTPHVYRKRTEI